MIPLRLTFSGIRDYQPTELDLAGVDSHIIITGPNGGGKSTITYCIGAVLYSSKVDIEGLKSHNLLETEPWNATISLLFRTEEQMNHAQTYIKFTLKIEQESAKSTLKKEYSISFGKEIDAWEETRTYISGNHNYNFSTYKHELQYKYKIDPDLYYLIWHQQEVNQFAVMTPEERFRIFSELHGIDVLQRNWEKSMEKSKETKERLRMTEANIKVKGSELSARKIALEHYLDNQDSVYTSAKMSIESLVQLEVHLHDATKNRTKVITTLTKKMTEITELLQLKRSQKEFAIKERYKHNQKQKKLAYQLEQNYRFLDEISKNMNRTGLELEALIETFDSIIEYQGLITKTEKEVEECLQQLSIEQEKVNKDIDNTRMGIKKLKDQWEDNMQVITELEQQINSTNKARKMHEFRLQEYKSSYAIQATIDALERKEVMLRDENFQQTIALDALRVESELLSKNHYLSVRQVQSLRYFRESKIAAFPLRELIELDDKAKWNNERIFDGIKYTIFFNGRRLVPPNDLYHVPLMQLVPDRSITALPRLHLQMKRGLSETQMNYAMKALWWVEQLFNENGPVLANDGYLIDNFGLRGIQEKEKNILSETALIARKQEVANKINKIEDSLANGTNNIHITQNQLQEYKSIIHKVQEAEAFMTNEDEHASIRRNLEIEIASREKVNRLQEELEADISTLTYIKIKQKQMKKKLQKEATFYLKHGKLADESEKLHELELELNEQREQRKQQKGKIDLLIENIEKMDRLKSKNKQFINEVTDKVEASEREIQIIKRQIDKEIVQMEKMEGELIETMSNLNEIETLMPILYTGVVMNRSVENVLSIHDARKKSEQGMILFDNARNNVGIDPVAQENYEKIKQEHANLNKSYKQMNILLDENAEQIDQLREQLDAAINRHVFELQQHFKSYMSEFEYEGEVSWEIYEDKRKRIRFKLFIKIRTVGHRGLMEDVGMKILSGRVGKGVSAGEEALCSLLFALALLQNIQTASGFIVLDEFDSSLDDNRKLKVFDLYVIESKRKLIVLTPKSHEETYFNRFSKAFIVQHDPIIRKSKVLGLINSKAIEIAERLEV